MNKNIKNVIVTPGNYQKSANPLPVVYLLHGYSDNYAKWIHQVPYLTQLADLYNILIVCPDGGFGSWYMDSPKDSSIKYETYISKELIKYVDSQYRTIKDKTGRAITGLSMGGHGAFYLAFKHQDLYGAAGSQSGGLDFRPFPTNWQLNEILGDYAHNQDNWEQNTVINLIYLLDKNSPAISFECGTSDFFYDGNKRFHQLLLERNIKHDYAERPGYHNWDYWRNSIKYQMLFFNDYFTKEPKR